METKLLHKAIEISNEINASALIIIPGDKDIGNIIEGKQFDFSIFVVTTPDRRYSGEHEEFKLSARGGTHNFAKQLQDATMMAYAKGKVKIEDKVVAVGGMDDESTVLSIYRVSEDPLLRSVYESTGRVDIEVMRSIVDLAIELGREGREGKSIGTAFVVGDVDRVKEKSRQLILNPYKCQEKKVRDIKDRDNWETVKELAQMDGVFLVKSDGEIVSAGRYLDVDAADLDIQEGLGARHMAAAGISKETDAVVISIARSGGIIRMFKDGEVIGEIDPRVRILPI